LLNVVLAFIAPIAGHVGIAITLTPFLVVNRRRFTIVPSHTIEYPSLSSHHHAFHRHPSPLCSRSIAEKLAPFHTVEEPSRHPLP
jgi:hypothetical protein